MGAAGAMHVVLLARDVKPESTRVTPDEELGDELDKEDEIDETLEFDKALERREADTEILEALEIAIEEFLELKDEIEEDTEDDSIELEFMRLAALELTEFTLEGFELELLPEPPPPQAESANAQTKYIIFIRAVMSYPHLRLANISGDNRLPEVSFIKYPCQFVLNTFHPIKMCVDRVFSACSLILFSPTGITALAPHPRLANQKPQLADSKPQPSQHCMPQCCNTFWFYQSTDKSQMFQHY